MPALNFLNLRIPNFIRNLGARIWEDQFEHTAPPIRHTEVAFVTLERKKKDNSYETVGTFVPELYELANTPEGSLKCQWQERIWRKTHPEVGVDINAEAYKAALKEELPSLYGKLYGALDNRKSPFELALLPTERTSEIHKAVATEFRHRRNVGLEIPAPISRLRLLPDYLNNLEAYGLRAKEFPNAIEVNRRNPHGKATTREKILHFLEWPAAVLLTASAAIALSGFASTWAILAGVVGLYIANIKSNEFSMFALAEALNRDLGWLTAKDIPWTSRFSAINTLKTVGKMATIGVAVYFAATIAWTGTFGLPWHLIGVNNTVQGLKIAAGLIFSTVAAAGTVAGLSATQRWFWNLSFNDTQIKLSDELVAGLPTLAPKARMYTSVDYNQKLADENAALRAALLEARSAPIIPQATAASSTPAPALVAVSDDDPASRSGLTLH